MKITIPKDHRSKIQTLRDELAAELEKLLKSNRELSSLSQRQESLEAEIAGLEKSANFENSEEVQSLGLKRIELEHLTTKFSQIPSMGGEQTEPARSLLYQIAIELTKALTPTTESYAGEIAKLLRPFCPNDTYAMGLAYQTPASISLTQVCSRRYGSSEFSLPIAQQAIKRCDEVLAGELDWKFDSNPGK